MFILCNGGLRLSNARIIYFKENIKTVYSSQKVSYIGWKE